MAGEYSRELSVKLARAHLQQAQLGFRQGGKLIYGFRRLLVGPDRGRRQVLNSGERKAVSSDKVLVIPGPPEELAVIRRIFRLYVRDGLSVPAIAKRLTQSRVTGYGGNPIRKWTIRHILSNELCIGQLTCNLTSKRLQGPTLRNPAGLDQVFSFRADRAGQAVSQSPGAPCANAKSALGQGNHRQRLAAAARAEGPSFANADQCRRRCAMLRDRDELVRVSGSRLCRRGL